MLFVVGGLGLPAGTKEALVALVSVSAIAVGFIATAKMILLTIDQRRVLRMLKQEGAFATLVTYMMQAITWSFASAILAGLALFLLGAVPDRWFGVLFACLSFVVTVAAVRSYQVTRIFTKILLAKE